MIEDINYEKASHGDLITLTRLLWAMPFGDLTRLHKEKAKELGSKSPSAVFLRAIVFSRLVSGHTSSRVGPPRV